MVTNTFGDRLAVLRAFVPDLSFRELDRLAGLGEGHSAQFVAGGKKGPRFATAKALAGVFGAPVLWLLDEQGKPPGKSKVRGAVEAARGKHAATVAPMSAAGNGVPRHIGENI